MKKLVKASILQDAFDGDCTNYEFSGIITDNRGEIVLVFADLDGGDYWALREGDNKNLLIEKATKDEMVEIESGNYAEITFWVGDDERDFTKLVS